MTRPDPTRPAKLWWLFYKLWGWVVFIPLVPALFLGGISLYSYNLAQEFDAVGRPATARIEDFYFEESTDSDGDVSITYYLDLTFKTRTGQHMAVTESVSSGLYHRAEKGAPLKILYLPDTPDFIETEPGQNMAMAKGTGIAASIMGLIALGIALFVLRQVRDAVYARKHGARITATSTGVLSTSMQVNNAPRYRLEWTTPDGQKGKSVMYKRGQIRGVPRGKDITVYQGRLHTWWDGDVGPKT